MSIKSIDTQIMIARLSDSVREASAMHKRPEVAQDVLAHRERINDAEQQHRVAKATESEMEEVRTDVDEGGGGSHSGEASSRDDDEPDDEVDQDMLVPPIDYLIDIIV